jgi:hypothetical protein
MFHYKEKYQKHLDVILGFAMLVAVIILIYGFFKRI